MSTQKLTLTLSPPGKDFLQKLQCPLVSNGIEGNKLRLLWGPEEGTLLQHLRRGWPTGTTPSCCHCPKGLRPGKELRPGLTGFTHRQRWELQSLGICFKRWPPARPLSGGDLDSGSRGHGMAHLHAGGDNSMGQGHPCWEPFVPLDSRCSPWAWVGWGPASCHM